MRPRRAPRVVDALGDWKLGEGPLFERLADAMRVSIERGTLPIGARLPSERTLANQLRLSRSTVVAAYERLKAERRVHTQRGSGTYVGGDAAIPSGRTIAADHLISILDTRHEPSRAVEFTVAALPGSRELTVANEAVARYLGALAHETLGYVPLGLPALRRQIAQTYTSRGLETSEDQILVTTGAQQAIYLVAQLFAGERIAIEDPTNPASIDAFRANDAELIALPIDSEGAAPKAIESAAPAIVPRAVYVADTYNNPTGTMLSRQRRERFVALARNRHFTLIEDETLCDISLEEAEPPAPMAAIDPRAAVISIGSACKLFWGGLRIGWIRTSADVIAQLYPLKTVADLGTSLVSQALTTELLPLRERVRRERRAQLRERYAVVEESLRRLLPEWSWERPRGGSSLWIELPRGNAAAFAQFAARYDIKIAPGPVFSVADRHQRRLRLPFVLDPDELAAGIERLAHAWALYTPHSMTMALDAVI
ncbi:MAG TPA: PLP-dependent aminotransferase family protein [Candidatus Binatia bacterium]|nr:PLP-dependent aminotransferase family protein [Candidatus Binatia bacterium]